MRALTIIAILGAATLGAGAGQAQELCLYGGPDPLADIACGRAYIPSSQPARAAGANAAAESRVTGSASRINGAAESRLLAGGRATPAAPALPYGYAPPPAFEASYAPPPAQFVTPDTWPAPDAAYAYAPDAAYAYAPNAAPPPPPSFDGFIAVEGSGYGPAPDAFAYAYESADGGAFAYRYETPDGPAWAYAYETPEGWAYAYAYDTAPDGPPPAMIQAYAPPQDYGPYRGPYVEQAESGRFDYRADWRYAEERLFGASFPRQLYLVQTYYRESEWRTVSAIPGRRYLCGGGGGYGGGYGYGAPAPGPRGGFIVSGGASGFGAGGSYLAGGSAGSSSRASSSFSESSFVSQTSQAQATATGNQTVIGGTPFNPPPGAPTPPWGPPAQISGGATSGAYAGANVGAYAGR